MFSASVAQATVSWTYSGTCNTSGAKNKNYATSRFGVNPSFSGFLALNIALNPAEPVEWDALNVVDYQFIVGNTTWDPENSTIERLFGGNLFRATEIESPNHVVRSSLR